MKNKHKGRYMYSKGEMEINSAFKMQEIELSELEVDTQEISQSIASAQSNISETKDKATKLGNDIQQLRETALAVAKNKSIVISGDLFKTAVSSAEKESVISILPSDERISEEEIPSWEEVVMKTDMIVQNEVILEDLLSAEEFQYCIEDVQRIDCEFAKKTKLNKVDISFLILATALQTARWIIIQRQMSDLGKKIDGNTRLAHDDKSIKDEVKRQNRDFQEKFSSHGHRESRKNYKSWEQIIFSSAPFDTTVNSDKFDEKLEGKFHRYKTLGHDPILGWIFGTANFITDTCTLSNFNSYRISRVGSSHFSEQTDLYTIFYEVVDSVKEDWLRLPAGVFAEFVHLKSDSLTKLGLPVPLLSAFSEELAGELYRSQYDSLCLLSDIKIVGNQAFWSILTNMLISLTHGLFYNEEKDGKRAIYEVRTRKILLYSNAISTSLNLAYVGAKASCGNAGEAWKKLDLGGLLVSLYRLFSDVRFITRVKEQFIKEEMDKVTEDALKELDSMFK